MSSRKNATKIAVHEESGIPSTRITCKKATVDEVLAAHWRRLTWWLNVWKRREKNTIFSGDFRFRFSAEDECPFSFSFGFPP